MSCKQPFPWTSGRLVPHRHFKHLPSTPSDCKNKLDNPSENLLQHFTRNLKLERGKKQQTTTKTLNRFRKLYRILTLSSVPSHSPPYFSKAFSEQLVPVRKNAGNLNAGAASNSSLKHELTLNNLHLYFQQQLHFKGKLENS